MISKIVDNYAIFDGERKEEQDFKSGKKRILIANLQTGSHAQNFQNCHYEIFYSNSLITLLESKQNGEYGEQDKKTHVSITT